jgi:hypothetical protein
LWNGFICLRIVLSCGFFSENNSQLSDSITLRKFIDQLSNCQLFNENIAMKLTSYLLQSRRKYFLFVKNKVKHDRQYMYNTTLRRIHESIVAVEKQ